MSIDNLLRVSQWPVEPSLDNVDVVLDSLKVDEFLLRKSQIGSMVMCGAVCRRARLIQARTTRIVPLPEPALGTGGKVPNSPAREQTSAPGWHRCPRQQRQSFCANMSTEAQGQHSCQIERKKITLSSIRARSGERLRWLPAPEKKRESRSLHLQSASKPLRCEA